MGQQNLLVLEITLQLLLYQGLELVELELQPNIEVVQEKLVLIFEIDPMFELNGLIQADCVAMLVAVVVMNEVTGSPDVAFYPEIIQLMSNNNQSDNVW